MPPIPGWLRSWASRCLPMPSAVHHTFELNLKKVKGGAGGGGVPVPGLLQKELARCGSACSAAIALAPAKTNGGDAAVLSLGEGKARAVATPGCFVAGAAVGAMLRGALRHARCRAFAMPAATHSIP